MVESLLLSYLPKALSHHKDLRVIRDQPEPPPYREVSALLARLGNDPRQVWETTFTARQLAAQCERLLLDRGIGCVSYWSAEYPAALREIEYPPWNLFYLGRLPDSNSRTLAIVGTRRPDDYGIGVLRAIVPKLNHRSLQIVSGLALGIDAAAHYFACETGIPNFAVLGSGIDQLYPAANTQLAQRILATGGGILSELPPGSPPRAENFPWRNRIVSGLSELVWVVQGTAKSGSVHTVDHAARQGRPVAATPGSIFSELSDVPNRLIYDGAQTILRAEDLDMALDRQAACRMAH